MSQLIAPSHTVVDSIPLGRRIYEIAKEKGSAFTITAMANRLNMSRETLRLMIKGEREIYTFELENISALLKVPVERILQEDIRERALEVRSILESKTNITRAIELAIYLKSVSIGLTEKTIYLRDLGSSYFANTDYDEAYNLFQQSYELALEVVHKFDDHDLMYNVLNKLMITMTATQNYTKLAIVLDRAENLFNSDRSKQASIYFSKAMIAERFKNFELVRENLYKSLEGFRDSGRINDVGRSEINVGYYEFQQKNYDLAKKYLEQAIVHLGPDVYYKMIAIKEYVKPLIKLGENDKAVHILEESLPFVEAYPVLKGKFYLLLAVAKNDPMYAENVFSIQGLDSKVLRMSCRFLTKYYIEIGDSEAVMKYSILEEKYYAEPKDIIHEEDL